VGGHVVFQLHGQVDDAHGFSILDSEIRQQQRPAPLLFVCRLLPAIRCSSLSRPPSRRAA
jgi:hypothetical protein